MFENPLSLGRAFVGWQMAPGGPQIVPGKLVQTSKLRYFGKYAPKHTRNKPLQVVVYNSSIDFLARSAGLDGPDRGEKESLRIEPDFWRARSAHLTVLAQLYLAALIPLLFDLWQFVAAGQPFPASIYRLPARHGHRISGNLFGFRNI